MTLFQFSRQERISFAQQLLITTDYIMQVIAVACGYTEGSNFVAAFKEITGTTPEEWRKSKGNRES